MTTFIFFISGLLLLLLGSKGVITNAIHISRLTKIPPFVIGATIVAIGTSLPELVVSFFGGVDNASNLALGNIIGSNIANIGLILGISLVLHPLYIGNTKTQQNMFVMLLVSMMLFGTLLYRGISSFSGYLFLLLGIGAIIWQIIQGKNHNIQETLHVKQTVAPVQVIGMFLVSLFSLFIGGKLLVDNGVVLANILYVPQALIGITAIALGTSLPELTVSCMALRKSVTLNEQKLVVGNILGSNIFNILFGAGILGVFEVKGFDSILSVYIFLFFTLLTCLLVFLFRGKTIPRYWGIILLCLYISYIVFLFLFS